jgi:hypothetical protein
MKNNVSQKYTLLKGDKGREKIPGYGNALDIHIRKSNTFLC